MPPVGIASTTSFRRRRRLPWIAVKPLPDDVVIELLGPEQPSERLSGDAASLVARPRCGEDLRIELVGVADARVKDRGELLVVLRRAGVGPVAESQTDLRRVPGGEIER